MSQEQLCFFKIGRPLLDLLGREFFRNLPQGPGVYVFVGANDRALYVGQSANLKSRLQYYKNAQPEREPRRIIRLVHQAREIRIHPCASAEEARLREIDFIREHRPKYNRALTQSRIYTYFRVSASNGSVQLRMSMDYPQSNAESWTGAFRSHGLCRRAFRAVGRTLWAQNHVPESVYGFPL